MGLLGNHFKGAVETIGYRGLDKAVWKSAVRDLEI